jgi:hypothetical protein
MRNSTPNLEIYKAMQIFPMQEGRNQVGTTNAMTHVMVLSAKARRNEQLK